MVQYDRMKEGEHDEMVMLDGTKILPDTVVNGLIMYLHIIYTVVYFLMFMELTIH